MMRVRVMLDVWLNVEAETEGQARSRVARIAHEAELDIDQIHAIGQILEIEPGEPEEEEHPR